VPLQPHHWPSLPHKNKSSMRSLVPLVALVSPAHAGTLSDQQLVHDDNAALSLLQLRATAIHDNTIFKHDVTEAEESPPFGGYSCALAGDTHRFYSFYSGSKVDMMAHGLYKYAESKDGRFKAQLYQSAAYASSDIGWITALAFDLDGNRLVVQSPPLSDFDSGKFVVNSYIPFEIRANDVVYTSADAPMTIPGTTIEIRAHKVPNEIEILTDGFAVRIGNGQGHAGKPSEGKSFYSWFNTAIRFDQDNFPPADDNSVCTIGPAATPIVDDTMETDWSSSFFTADDHSRICDFQQLYNKQYSKGKWVGKCTKPPPMPPAPPAKKECEQHECSWIHAQELCHSLEGDTGLYEACLFDFCVACDDYGASSLIEEIEDESPEPICVQGATECNPDEVCAKSVKMNTLSVTQSNLGGVGPDSGAEEIRYGNAAVVNGKAVDLVLTTDGTFKSSKPSKNGNSGAFGVLNVKCGSSVTVTMKVVDSDSGAPVVLDAVALTWYDLDEGKKEKGRASVKTCGSTGAIVTDNTELTLKREGDCSTATSSVAGTGKDNPKNPNQLDSLQVSRSVTLPYKGVSELTSTLSLAAGPKGRNFLFALEPSVPCRRNAH